MLKKYLLMTLMLGASASAQPSQKMEGTFVRIDQGDYSHLILKDQAGKERDFFLWNGGKFDQLLDKPETYKGKRVQITWRNVTRNIPEAGGKMQLDEATSIRVLK